MAEATQRMLHEEDFVSSQGGSFEESWLSSLGFPRDWPAVYSTSPALKALLGKKGSIPARKVAVAGGPTEDERRQVPVLSYAPLRSFDNAEMAARACPGLQVVKGWAIYERLDREAGAVFVAEKFWWNALPNGAWVDLTPRPASLPQLLLAEAVDPPSKSTTATAAARRIEQLLLAARFPDLPRERPSQPVRKQEEPAPKPRNVPAPAPMSQQAAPAPAKAKGLDYSKFNNIEDSDDERPVPRKESLVLPMGLPREAVTKEEYCKVWQTLLSSKDFATTPAPDLETLWGYYKYGGMDEQALLDQACEFLGQFPRRLPAAEWKAKTYTLTKRLELESREDEARMWSVITICRFPEEADAYYNQGVLLTKQCDKVKFSGAPMARIPSLDGSSKLVPTEQYCSLFSRAASSYYRKCLKLDPKNRPAYINLIGNLERNEPAGWYNDVHELATTAVRQGIWFNMWQRPPHFVPTLLAKPFHDAKDYRLCHALEENFSVIKGEYEAYMDRLLNRKDWDDSDKTPGLGDVGNREGALHDGGLRKSGTWREVPLFTNCTLQREYGSLFPETVRILQAHCQDATGLALCGGGDVIFSVLTPGTRLRAHCGPSNSRLTCHLAIRVPRSEKQGCLIRVGAEEPRGWREGRCLVFDDSFEHEVIYEEAKSGEPYPGERVVLLLNFWHPDFDFKNDPEWRQKSDEMMRDVEVESLPKTAVMKVPPAVSPVPAA